MGTLYNCLREVRLEKYYPAFRANGITCYESLANLTMAELVAMGISGSEDRRRLVELVNIIKSVSRSESSSSGSGAVPRKRHPNSPTPSSSSSTSSARSALAAAAGGGPYSSGSQSEKKVPRRRPRSPPEGAVGGGAGSSSSSGMRLEATRDVSVRERGPNFSVGSYLDMLDFMSDESHSDAGGDHRHSSDDGGDGDATPPPPPPPLPHPRSQPPPPPSSSALPSRNAARKLAASGSERRSQARSKGYNYGVPGTNSSRDAASASSSVKAKGRGGGGGAGGGKVAKDEKIRVCVRKRPVSRRERRAGEVDIVDVEGTSSVVVREPKATVDLTAFTLKHEFVFDEVFDEDCTNEDVYIRAARPLITTVFQRSNATFFAYGQTGAGKTHTMMGGSGVPGLYQLAAQDVFDIKASGQYGTDLHVWLSFFEIYCGQLFDLLNRRNRLVAREDGAQRVCIAGLTETEVPDVQTLIKVLQFGNSVRSRGTSGVNPDSSRSHAVLQMEIRRTNDAILGKISFIDLAGSERASDMGDPDRQTRMEGAEINQSLLALKECIRSIDQESRHTPFRQSKLTHILKDAFVGNSRTCMIANLSPVMSACEHSLNTLRYADRVKELRRDNGHSPGGGSGGGGAGGGSSLGQAMNLLMNIPITAPSIFHPSNVLSTSTPVRPRLHPPPTPSSSSSSSHAAADVTLDPSETPIRGHNVFPKSSSRVRAARAPSEVVGAKARVSGAGASQGLGPPHPEASPSESEQTDTDSNNVTQPSESRHRPRMPNMPDLPVIRSTDTDFDFPTSDFNMPDDDDLHPEPLLNDLSQGGHRRLAKVKSGWEAQGQDQGQGQAASAGGVRSEGQKGQERWASSPSPTNQLSGKGVAKASAPHRHSPPPSPGPQPTSKTSPTGSGRGGVVSHPHPPPPSGGARAAVSELGNGWPASITQTRPSQAPPAMDSLDDELLFGGPPGDNGGSPSQASGAGAGGDSKAVMKVLPGLQTALSSDLTSFSQRSPLRAGAVEKASAVPSPRDPSHPLPPCLSHHVSPSPRQDGSQSDRGGVVGGGGKEPPPGKGTDPLPSPSGGAVGERASPVTTGADPGSSRSTRTDNPKGAESASAHAHLPFAAYSAPVTSPQPGRQGSQLVTDVGDGPSDIKPFPSYFSSSSSSPRGLSGPSSDPVVGPSMAGSAFGAKDGSSHASSSSASLPASRSQAAEPHFRHDWSDTSGTPVCAKASTNFGRSNSSDNSVYTKTSAHSRNNSSDNSVYSKAPSSALVTEKLMSGAVFSPIHPQPVSTTGGVQPVFKGRALSSGGGCGGGSGLVHPTPVSGVSSVPVSVSTSSGSVVSSPSFSVAERDQARISLVGSHEDQLAAITSLCKQEMKLLLHAKKAVPRSFEDYLTRVSAILSQKMGAIQRLQESIALYQTTFTHPHPSSSAPPPAPFLPPPAPASASGASSNDGAGFHLS